MKDLSLNTFGKLIVHTTSSMTRLIEILYQVELRVKLLRQQKMVDCPPLIHKNLPVEQKNPILRELYLLDTDSLPYYYAEVIFDKDEIRSDLLHDLYQTDIPIGKMIEKYRVEIYRDILDYGTVQNAQIANHLAVNANQWLIYKVTRMQHQEKNLFFICEYFPIERLQLSS